MIFSSRQLSQIAGLPIVLANRAKLTAEKKFEHTVQPSFSEEELLARENDYREILSPVGRVPQNCDWLRVYASLGTIWQLSQNKLGSWTKEACAIGKTLFGDHFQDFRSFCHSTGAVVVPTSPFLDAKEFWKAFTAGFPVSMPRDKNLEGILQLHETGHSLFSFTLEERQNPEIAYRYEAYADGFAVSKYRELNGPEQDIEDFIAGRRLSSFIDFMPAYSTANACETVLAQKPFPTFLEVLNPLRELQIRVVHDLQGIDRSDWSNATYREKCTSIDFKGVKIDNVWSPDNEGLYDIFTEFSAGEIKQSLKRVTNWNISDEARAEGDKILKAFSRLCPVAELELKEAPRPNAQKGDKKPCFKAGLGL